MLKTGYLGDVKLQIELADNFWRRFLGLMGRKRLPAGRGLLITSCNSVHMCFMRFPIDVVYFDKDYTVLKIVRRLRPWLGVSFCRGAYAALELTAGATNLDTMIGQRLRY